MSIFSKAVKKVVNVTPVGAYFKWQDREADKANKKNQEAIDRANKYSLYTWDLANQYNSPEQQMARLKAAGLNPNLVYGSGNVTGNTAGVADSAGAAAVQHYNKAEDAKNKVVQIAQAYAGLRNTNMQSELLNYQMGQTEAQTEYTKARTQDLNNFLTGSGPSTYDRYRAPATTAPTDPTNVDDSSFDLGSFYEDLKEAALGAVPYGSKAKKASKFMDKYKIRLPFDYVSLYKDLKDGYNRWRSR